MKLPSAINGNCAGWRLLVAVALALLVSARAVPAVAGDEDAAFTATVKVDASADSADKARELARIDGQRRALAAVIAHASSAADMPPLTKLDDKTITDMVDSFEVANERMSAVRYLADYTFHFRPSKVRPLLRNADSAAADANGKGTVVLAVYKDGAKLVLWEDPNPWRAAWSRRPSAAGPVRLNIPLGDAGDIASIDAQRAQAGNSAALSAIAEQNGGDEVIVALATARRQEGKLAGIDLSAKRYRLGHLADTQETTLDADPGESENAFLRRAVDAVAVAVESGTKKDAAAGTDPQARLAAIVPISSLGDWVRMRDRLGSVPEIRKVDLLSLTLTEAKVEIRFVGGADQLKSGLAAIDLALAGGEPVWRLERAGTTNPGEPR